MKRIQAPGPGGLLAALLVAGLVMVPASAETIPYLLESQAPSTTPDTFIWATEPGVRYDLWESDALEDWRPVVVAQYPAIDGFAVGRFSEPSHLRVIMFGPQPRIEPQHLSHAVEDHSQNSTMQ